MNSDTEKAKAAIDGTDVVLEHHPSLSVTTVGHYGFDYVQHVSDTFRHKSISSTRV